MLSIDSLNPQQIQAVQLLAAGQTYDQICQSLSVSRTTLYRWRLEPAFAAVANQLVTVQTTQALAQSAQLLTQSMDLIQKALSNPETPLKLQISIAFRLISIFSRPNHLRHLQALSDSISASPILQPAHFNKPISSPLAPSGHAPTPKTTLGDSLINPNLASPTIMPPIPAGITPIQPLARNKMKRL
jgi:hypothetical protein